MSFNAPWIYGSDKDLSKFISEYIVIKSLLFILNIISVSMDCLGTNMGEINSPPQTWAHVEPATFKMAAPMRGVVF